jgi:hypothetical protein
MVKQASSVFSVDVTGLEGAVGQPTYVRICDRIRGAITGGALAPNARLPSSRVVTSTQQAVELAGKVLADQGEQAWVETPGYQPVLHCLRAAGLQVVPVPVDEQGLDVSKGPCGDRGTSAFQVWCHGSRRLGFRIRGRFPRRCTAGLGSRAAGNHNITCPV